MFSASRGILYTPPPGPDEERAENRATAGAEPNHETGSASEPEPLPKTEAIQGVASNGDHEAATAPSDDD